MKKGFFIAGNWKMHKTAEESRQFVADLDRRSPFSERVRVVVFPPYTSLPGLKAISGRISIGAQNMFYEEKGAFTGEVSPLQLQGLVDYVLVGHSERRQIFNESDDMVQKKVAAALKHDLVPVLCVGEALADRERGETFAKVCGQLEKAIEGLSAGELQRVVIAYEPVWAIGTGRNATPEQADEVHRFIREILQTKVPDAQALYILYGGSVKPENSYALLSQPEVDGLLIGGASLHLDNFFAIIGQAISLA